MLWSVDTCQKKVSADQYHVTILRAQVYSSSRSRGFFEVDRWPSAGFSIGSWADLRLTFWKQGRIVRKPVNANPGLKVNRIITFLLYKCFLLLCFVYIVIIKTQNRRPNNIQKTSPQSYKTQIKILPFPGSFGSEQPGPRATLLGWPKSIYYTVVTRYEFYVRVARTIYYINNSEIPGFFLLLKNHIFIARSKDTTFIFHTVKISFLFDSIFLLSL